MNERKYCLLLSGYPKIGKCANDRKVRISIVREYLIFYEFNEREIIILSIWDARRDAKDIEFQY
ncbi:MAG: hypothetical protein R2760_09610 [Chitinophagales bacterium]